MIPLGSQKFAPIHRIFGFWRGLSPPLLLVASFVALISLATFGLLVLPGLYTGERLSFIDALFTATSAVCVTGLTVVNTATSFTRIGQLWILVFIQLGGLGLVSLATFIIRMVGQRLSLRSEMIAVPRAERHRRHAIPALLAAITRFTLIAEAIGALYLFLLFLPKFGVGDAAFQAIFHAVSAFCNAGFSTFPTSLIELADAPFVLLVISALIILGGIGYLSGEELLAWLRVGGAWGPRRLSSHTFAALGTTLILLFGGTIAFALFEKSGVLAFAGPFDFYTNAWFMSVTARTAGFQTVSYLTPGNEAIVVTVLLMFIGGSPGSMAGGIKTTAVAVLSAIAIDRMRGRRDVSLHERAVPSSVIERTVSLVLLAAAIVAAAVFALMYTETHGMSVAEARAAFLPLLFEAVSAFGTVGLSMDVTPTLSTAGKLVIIGLMLVGRVGPLSFVAAISLRGRAAATGYRLAQEDLIIG